MTTAYAFTPAGTPPRSDRRGVPAPGCMLVLLAPFIVALLVAGTLMYVDHRQNTADERNEKEALRQVAALADAYGDDVLAETDTDYPSEARTREIAEGHYGTLVTYTPSDDSLTTVVEFFATYEDTSFFGTSASRVHRCYSYDFRRSPRPGSDRTTLPLDRC